MLSSIALVHCAFRNNSSFYVTSALQTGREATYAAEFSGLVSKGD
jgi:hypothetical protein